MSTSAKAQSSTKNDADGMKVTREYIRQCDLNLTRARTFKGELKKCYAQRVADAGKSNQQDKTIKQLTKAGEVKDKRIATLESRWSTLRLVGVGVAAGSCTAFAVSMFGEADGWTRLVSGVGCLIGVGLTWKW